MIHPLRAFSRPDPSVSSSNETCLTTDPHTQTLDPFVFLHIPKTAGSALRMLVSNLFDADRFYDGLNYEDYAMDTFLSRLDLSRQSVFVGHMSWDNVTEIARRSQRKPIVMTAIRNPITHAKSQLAFGDVLAHSGITKTVGLDGNELDFVNYWTNERKEAEGGHLTASQIALLIGGEFAPLRSAILSDNITLQTAAIQRTRDLLASRLEDDMILIQFEDLRRSIDLLCHKLQLRYLPVPEQRMNATGTGQFAELTPMQMETFSKWRGLPTDFDTQARQKFEAAYKAAFAGVTDIAKTLNESYRDAVRTSTPYCNRVRFADSSAWPGIGWGLRQTNAMHQFWRTLGADGCGILFIRLVPDSDYTLTLNFHSVPPSDLEQNLSVFANSERLDLIGSQYVERPMGSKGVKKPAQIGSCLAVEFKLPRATVARDNGQIDLKIQSHHDNHEDVLMHSIQVEPIRRQNH